MLIKDINELLTKILQQKCYLEDDLTSFYKLKFPNISSIDEFNELQENAERFFSQYGLKTGTMAILYPKEANKVFVLPINKLPLHTTLEKLDVLWKDSQLHEAVNSNQIFQLKENLDNGADINSKNIVGDTMLHIATRQDYLPIISLLLEKGALANISKNNKGETPLEIVDRKSDAVIGKAFIDTVLNKNSKAEKPKLTMQLLSDYWVEQSLKQANKSTDQEFTKAEVDTAGSQRVKELVRCFFSKSPPPMDEQSLEKNNVTSLTK